ncbi:MAG: PIN domain-containing protein [Oscillatoria sp. SIO1A7]|nr:PIN domain-containing protein [Oscillatoria sp. SIO1A7]
MNVLVDTNVILDALLEREPFATDARSLFVAIQSKQILGYVTATTVTDIFYIVRKNRGSQIAKQAVSTILAEMEVCTVDRRILELAVSYEMSDFEDAVQLACAIADNLEAIVTRNPQDFTNTSIPILSAGELLARLS